MTEATVWSSLSAAGLAARSVISSCQRSTAACLLALPLANLVCLPLILMYHQASDLRNQGLALRGMDEPSNQRVVKYNAVDWRSPRLLPAWVMAGQEAFRQDSVAGKVQRKVQSTTVDRSHTYEGTTVSAKDISNCTEWAMGDLNPRHPPCKGGALAN